MAEDYKTPAGAPPDWRGLCAELTEHLALLDEPPHELVCRAQEALAQSEPEVVGPTDEELRELRYYGFTTSTGHGERVDEIGFARAVLARWGHQPAPPVAGADCPACEGVPKPGNQPCAVCGRPAPVPAEGDVAELVAALSKAVDGAMAMGWEDAGFAIQRAADLLQQHQAVPVAVSERLPGPEDCDAKGQCWQWDEPSDAWVLYTRNGISIRWQQGVVDYWLPANALPLPGREVEHG